MGEGNKHRIFIAVRRRSFPHDQRSEMGYAFYHWDLIIEPKKAKQGTTIWNAYCSTAAMTASWKTGQETTRLSDQPTLVVRVMVGKVTKTRLPEAKRKIMEADTPNENHKDDGASWIWCRNALAALQHAGIVGPFDLNDALAFAAKAADRRETDDGADRSDKQNFATKLTFP